MTITSDYISYGWLVRFAKQVKLISARYDDSQVHKNDIHISSIPVTKCEILEVGCQEIGDIEAGQEGGGISDRLQSRVHTVAWVMGAR